jgi:hypothetical protein
LAECTYGRAIVQRQTGRAGSDSRPDPTLHASLQVLANMSIGEDALLRYICIVLETVHSNTITHLQKTLRTMALWSLSMRIPKCSRQNLYPWR